MLNQVDLSPSLLEIVNTRIPFFDSEPEGYAKWLFFLGFLSFLTLVSNVAYRLWRGPDLAAGIEEMKVRLSRMFRSSLLTRLCLMTGAIVIVLIFYVNTKEHYWTAKHTAMLFSGFLALGTWLAVCTKIPRFRVPYAWPVALILASASVSMLRAVNIAEGIGELYAIFGSAVFMYLASQVLSTSKRIHLFVVTLVLVGACVSVYGLAQSYLLVPTDFVFALDNRAPVSTAGNKNYASYVLDLVMPLAMVLAVSRRHPLQTLCALSAYFLNYWHFSMCDTRGGTISMGIGILLTTVIVAVFHGRKFRLLLYVLLMAPYLWSGLEVSDITYANTQSWGSGLAGREGKGAVAKALLEVMPDEAKPYAQYARMWFLEGNEIVLGLNGRLPALLIGFTLALGLFGLLLKYRKDWKIHLGAAMVLAFLPFFLAMFTMPGRMTPTQHANAVIRAVQENKMENLDTAIRILNQYALPMSKAVAKHNEMFLHFHQDVAAMMSLILFTVMATFLLFRWYDRRDGWAPGFAVIGGLGIWYLVFLLVKAGGGIGSRLFSDGLFESFDYLWPINLQPLQKSGSVLGFLFNGISFLFFSLASLGALVAVMQYIPTHFSREQCDRMLKQAVSSAKIAVPVAVLILLAIIWNTDRIRYVRKAMHETYTQENILSFAGGEQKTRLASTLFAGAHALFNTQAKIKGQASDGAIGFRLEIYQGTLRKIRDNPILGIGPGNFKIINPHPKYETALERRILGREVLGRKAHNDFLEDATENGIFGLVGILWMFTVTGALLYRSLKIIHLPRNATDVFVNSLAWGLSWAMIAIVIHANFEMPLFQPSSTYLCWMLFGVVFQLDRIHRRRLALSVGAIPADPTVLALAPGNPIPPDLADKSPAWCELPKPAATPGWAGRFAKPWVAWPILATLVLVVTDTHLMRQYVGEMWLRWGMVFSEGGIQRYDLVFEAMEKASEVYPQQMETNYILGRYCIDSVQILYPPWRMKTRTDLYNDKQRAANEAQIQEVKKRYHLDVDDLIYYSQLGVDVHRRDIFMNPHYKWAHNNMGVLCDKLALINADLAAVEKDPVKKTHHQQMAAKFEKESRDCYSKALEVDDLQVYALFNLGIGSFTKDRDYELAEKYFSRTLLADPRKGDVNVFIAKCRFAQRNFGGAADAVQALFDWHRSSPVKNDIEASDVEELEGMLHQIAVVSQQQDDPETTRKCYSVLAENYDACAYKPMLASATVRAGSPEKGLELAQEALLECTNRPPAEAVYVEAWANSLLGRKQEALAAFTMLTKSNAKESFRQKFQTEPGFDLIRDTDEFSRYLKDSATATNQAPASLPASATPISSTPPP